MAPKFKIPKFKFSTRSIIAGAFVLLICVAAYTDSKLGNNISEGGYLYTSAETKEEDKNPKILGEAAFVDNTQDLVEAGENANESTEAGAYDSYFSAMQVDRQRSRQEAYTMLQNVVDSAESMPDVKEKAYNEMLSIANDIKIESNIRSMVMAKGFEDCLAVINGDSLSVVVKSGGLLMNEVAQIKEIAINESGFSAENIKVVEKG